MVRLIGKRQDERGASLIEYALLAALIALAVIGSLRLLGPRISRTFNNVTNAMP